VREPTNSMLPTARPWRDSLPDEDHAAFSPERDDWKLGLTLEQRETCVGARKRSRVLRLAWRAAICPTQARPEGRRRVTGPLAGAVAGPVGPVAVAEEAVAAAGVGPVAAAEEAVAGWWRRWPRAAASAGATSAHRSTSRPTSAAACRPYGARRDHPGAYRRSSSGRGSGADAAPAAHPTYAGTHSAKSSAVAYSRLINPRRGPTGSAEETDACFIVCDHNRQALAYVYFEDEPGRRAAAKLLTRDEARRVATNVAKLADLLRSPS
jgi:hypothetical protein